ncbi:MAG: hypothetical protein IJ111_08485, partial [Eggerthellaceae bacterium]|nr:hypothetical protein [Eggerthellaceae bacterium]
CKKVAKTARLAWRGLRYLPALSRTLPCGDAAVTSEVASSSLVHPATKLLVSPLNGLAFCFTWGRFFAKVAKD